MEIEVRLPQLDETNEKIGCIGNDAELCVKLILALDKKIDALALAVAAPGPVQTDLPLAEKPTPKAKRARRVTEEVKPAPHVTETVKGNGEDHDDDEDALRARAMFESKRVQRILGVGAMRAVIKNVAGATILNVDDVPVQQLSALLTELQAM